MSVSSPLINLSEEDEKLIKTHLQDKNNCPTVVKKLKMLLLASEKSKLGEIANALKCQARTVKNCIVSFLEGGVNATLRRSGRHKNEDSAESQQSEPAPLSAQQATDQSPLHESPQTAAQSEESESSLDTSSQQLVHANEISSSGQTQRQPIQNESEQIIDKVNQSTAHLPENSASECGDQQTSHRHDESDVQPREVQFAGQGNSQLTATRSESAVSPQCISTSDRTADYSGHENETLEAQQQVNQDPQTERISHENDANKIEIFVKNDTISTKKEISPENGSKEICFLVCEKNSLTGELTLLVENSTKIVPNLDFTNQVTFANSLSKINRAIIDCADKCANEATVKLENKLALSAYDPKDLRKVEYESFRGRSTILISAEIKKTLVNTERLWDPNLKRLSMFAIAVTSYRKSEGLINGFLLRKEDEQIQFRTLQKMCVREGKKIFTYVIQFANGVVMEYGFDPKTLELIDPNKLSASVKEPNLPVNVLDKVDACAVEIMEDYNSRQEDKSHELTIEDLVNTPRYPLENTVILSADDVCVHKQSLEHMKKGSSIVTVSEKTEASDEDKTSPEKEESIKEKDKNENTNKKNKSKNKKDKDEEKSENKKDKSNDENIDKDDKNKKNDKDKKKRSKNKKEKNKNKTTKNRDKNRSKKNKSKKKEDDKEKLWCSLITITTAEGHITVYANTMLEAAKTALAILLKYNLLSDRYLLIITDGYKPTIDILEKIFSFREQKRFIYDWYHLKKKCYEFFTRALKGGKENFERNKEIRKPFYKYLFEGHIEEAIKYLLSLDKNLIKDETVIQEFINYLNGKKENTYCYYLRKRLKLINSSNRVEKANDLIIAERCKNNGTSWCRLGVDGIGFQRCLIYDHENNWFTENRLDFELTPLCKAVDKNNKWLIRELQEAVAV